MGRTLQRIVLALLLLSTATWAESTSLLLSPAPDSKVQADDLIISATVSGPLKETLNLGEARLWVKEQEVTLMCLRNDSYLSFRPFTRLEPGPVEVRLKFPNGVVREWSFEVQPTRLIEKVTHNAGDDALGEYQELKVVLRGEPGVRATFSLGNKDKEYPMEEESRGTYVGTYTVKPGDYYLEEPVTGHLHLGSREETLQAEEPVKIFGHLFRVHIISPESGSKVPLNFPIKGRTRPNSKVALVPRISFQNNTSAPNTNLGGGGVGSIETRADDEGYFEVNYGLPMKLPNIAVVMSVFAVSPEGERSVPVTLRYRF